MEMPRQRLDVVTEGVESTLDPYGFESEVTDAEDEMWAFVDVTETLIPFTEACKANKVRVRAVELGDGITIQSACKSKSGWVSVDSSGVALPPRRGCRLQGCQDVVSGQMRWQMWYPRNAGDVHESNSIKGDEKALQSCLDWAWRRHEASWVGWFHICLVHMRKLLGLPRIQSK